MQRVGWLVVSYILTIHSHSWPIDLFACCVRRLYYPIDDLVRSYALALAHRCFPVKVVHRTLHYGLAVP